MHTKESLIKDIKAIGIKNTDTVTVHTSLKAIGNIDDTEKSGAEVLIDSLCECVLEGLLIVPSHTFVNLRETGAFDIRNTVPCIGTLPRVAVELANRAYDNGDDTCIRSMQASHSVVAFGKSAREFVKADDGTVTRTPPDGCYGSLCRLGGKILLIGVGLSSNTFIHMIDEYLEPKVYDTTEIILTDYNGKSRKHVRNITKGPAAASFVRYEEALEKSGAITYGTIGDAKTMLLDAQICFDTVMSIRKKELGIS